VLSGGRRITGWGEEDGRWSAELPEASAGAWRFRQLFVNGERRLRPRLPREGYFRGEGGYGGDAGREGTDRFRYTAGDLDPSWRNPEALEVVALHFWVDAHLPVERIDGAKRLVTFRRKSRRRLSDDFTSAGARYYVENVHEALGAGEWYLEAEAGRLEYVPRAGETIGEAEVIAPHLTDLVRFEGEAEAGRFVEHVRLSGLGFSHNAWDLPADSAGDLQAAVGVPGAVTLTGARDCRIEGCTFGNLGT
jgi:hypothetical protein